MVPDVSDTELKLMQALWEAGPSSIRTLTDRLYPGGNQSHYATVQKLLDRLEAKRCVRRDRSVVPHIFGPTISRDEYLGGRMRAMAERLCGGSLTPLLTHLLKTETLSDEDRKELRKLLGPPKAEDRG